MDAATLWSLRLGFSSKEAEKIKLVGIKKFLDASFSSRISDEVPAFLDDSPKSLKELNAIRKDIKDKDPEKVKDLVQREAQTSLAMKDWWLEQMMAAEYPLREKMTCFWHNHFVATYQKVRVNHWIFQHNQTLREHAFGNFRTLTKKVVQSNAMVRYLDNVENRKGKINENLSRELLELFTLGIGNYSETDIKNGAKALAGLGIGEEKAQYRSFFEDNDEITYLGKTGRFKADEIIDIIFEQKAAPYLITRKILKWFIYDAPPEDLVLYYGDYFRKVDYEIQPLLQKMFTEEFAKNTAGSKIKDPLLYILQLKNELHIEQMHSRLLTFFLRQQGMDLFGQPNVKGWNGGNEWLSSQIYLQRHNAADLLCSKKPLSRLNLGNNEAMNVQMQPKALDVSLDFDASGNHKTIIADLQNRLLFQVNPEMQAEFETVLKYDFDPKSEGAQNAVLRLCNAMVKRPEFQLL